MEITRSLIVILVFFVTFAVAAEIIEYSQLLSPPINNGYDVLIFALSWPLTGCYSVKRNAPKKNCNLPDTKRFTIHGLWPSKLHGVFGPEHCDKSLRFDLRALGKLYSQLNANWMTNDATRPNEWLWQHEWDKHGTCSVDLPQISTQELYFKMGLKLQQDYNMIEILEKAKIYPGKVYKVQNYLDGITQVLGKSGFVSCMLNKEKQESYLAEIRVCFDKKLQLINCKGIYAYPTNCNWNLPVLFPSGVPGI